MTETRSGSIIIDTGKLVHHPSRDISHKDMIQRGIPELRTQGPGFRQRRISHCFHPIPPGGSFRLRNHLHRVLDIAVAGQHSRNRLASQQAEIEEMIVGTHDLAKFIGHQLLFPFRYNSQIEGDRLCCLGSFRIDSRFGIEEFTIDQVFQFIGFLPVRSGIFAQQFGETGHQGIIQIIIGGRGIGIVGRRLPVHPIP